MSSQSPETPQSPQDESLADAIRRARQSASQPNAQPAVDALLKKLEEMRAVPSKFESAVREFASWIGLDADALVRGETFDFGGVELTLVHYGVLDPDGATVIVDFGEFKLDEEAAFYRRLLEHNFHTPAGLHGWYALAPGIDKMLFCVRVDLKHAENPAGAIGTVVGTAVESIRAMRDVAHRQLTQSQNETQGTQSA